MATRSEALAWLMDLTWASEREFIKKFGRDAQELVSSLRDLKLIKYGAMNGVSVLVPTTSTRTKKRGYE